MDTFLVAFIFHLSKCINLSVILLPVHPAYSLTILSLGCKVFILARPRMQLYCRLVMKNKIVFWTHKFAVGLIDLGNSESQDPQAQ